MSPPPVKPAASPPVLPSPSTDALYGREDVLSEIDRRLEALAARSRQGAVLLVGSKGTGKSKILATWLARHQQECLEYKGSQVSDTMQYLCRQLEDRLGQLTGSATSPVSANLNPQDRMAILVDLLSQAAKSAQTRLILLLRILDGYRGDTLSAVLPPLRDGIFFVSSATLTSNVQRLFIDLKDGQCANWDIELINLDEPRYQRSALQACQLYWQDWLAQFPSAQAAIIDQTLRSLALQRAGGNFLYLRKLCQWIGKDKGPVASWSKRLQELPSDLLELQKRRWDQEGYTPAQRQRVLDGLCLLAAAYVPLPRSVLNDVLGLDTSSALWGDSPDASFWLVSENSDGSESGRGETQATEPFADEDGGNEADDANDSAGDRSQDQTLRLFHPVVADFLRRQLGQEAAIKAAHRKLALASVAKWQNHDHGFWRDYALRFAAAHLIEAGSPRSAVELFGSTEFLAAQVALGLGTSSFLETLQRAASLAATKDLATTLTQLADAVRADSRFLQQEPACLLDQLHFRLTATPSTQPGLALSLLRAPLRAPRLRRAADGPTEEPGLPVLGRHAVTGEVLGLAVLPMQQVVSANRPGELLVFSLDQPGPPQAWPDASNPPFAAVVSDGALWLCSDIGDGCGYPLRPREAGQPLPVSSLPLTGTYADPLAVVAPLPSGMLTVSEQGQIVRVPGSQPAAALSGPVAAAWCEDGLSRAVLGLAADGTPTRWRLTAATATDPTAEEPLGQPRPCPMVPGSGWALVGLQADDGLLSLWDLGSDAGPKPMAQCDAHAGLRVRCCAFSADGQLALSGDDGGRICVWEVATGRLRQQRMDRGGAAVTAVAWVEAGRHAVLGFADGTVKRWALESGTVAASRPPAAAVPSLWALCGPVEGNRVLAQAADGLYLCNAVASQKLSLDPRIADPIAAVPVAQGREIVVWTLDEIWVCDLAGKALAGPLPHPLDERLLAALPDGKRLVLATADSAVCIAHLDDGRRVPLADLSDAALGLLAAVSPDGSRIACAQPGRLGLWDADSGACLASLPAVANPQALQLAECDSGLKLLLVCEQGIQVYDLATDHLEDIEPQPLHTLADSVPGPIDIRSAHLLRDGSLLLLNSGIGPNWLRVADTHAVDSAAPVAALFEFSGVGGLAVRESSPDPDSDLDGGQDPSEPATAITVLDRDGRLCPLVLLPQALDESAPPRRVRIIAHANDQGQPWDQSLRDQLASQSPPFDVLEDEGGQNEAVLPADADVVVLLLSARAVSDPTWKTLAAQAIERQAQGRCLVVAVRARSVGSLDADYGTLEILPLSKRSLSQLPSHELDDACSQIAAYILDRLHGCPLWQGSTLEQRLGSEIRTGAKA